jgi:hypothetical protein
MVSLLACVQPSPKPVVFTPDSCHSEGHIWTKCASSEGTQARTEPLQSAGRQLYGNLFPRGPKAVRGMRSLVGYSIPGQEPNQTTPTAALIPRLPSFCRRTLPMPSDETPGPPIVCGNVYRTGELLVPSHSPIPPPAAPPPPGLSAPSIHTNDDMSEASTLALEATLSSVPAHASSSYDTKLPVSRLPRMQVTDHNLDTATHLSRISFGLRIAGDSDASLETPRLNQDMPHARHRVSSRPSLSDSFDGGASEIESPSLSHASAVRVRRNHGGPLDRDQSMPVTLPSASPLPNSARAGTPGGSVSMLPTKKALLPLQIPAGIKLDRGLPDSMLPTPPYAAYVSNGGSFLDVPLPSRMPSRAVSSWRLPRTPAGRALPPRPPAYPRKSPASLPAWLPTLDITQAGLNTALQGMQHIATLPSQCLDMSGTMLDSPAASAPSSLPNQLTAESSPGTHVTVSASKARSLIYSATLAARFQPSPCTPLTIGGSMAGAVGSPCSSDSGFLPLASSFQMPASGFQNNKELVDSTSLPRPSFVAGPQVPMTQIGLCDSCVDDGASITDISEHLLRQASELLGRQGSIQALSVMLSDALADDDTASVPGTGPRGQDTNVPIA